jgi:uncharacterized beta-barrel protein YwiB (DUF1934 family)
MLKKVRIQIITDRYEMQGSLYETPMGKMLPDFEAEMPVQRGEVEHLEMTTEASYHDDGTLVCIRYKENELSGMEGSRTLVSFHKKDPQMLSMMRDGSVKTAMVFEAGKRHTTVYQTPIMPFEVCIFTRKVDNRIEQDGTLCMDYAVELRGAQTERTNFFMRVLPDFDKPMKR